MIRPVLVAEKSPAVAKVHLKSAQLIGMSCEPICVTGWPVEAMIHLTGRWDKSENSSSPVTQSLFMSRSGPWRLTMKDYNIFQYECHIYILYIQTDRQPGRQADRQTDIHTFQFHTAQAALQTTAAALGIHIFGSGPLGPVGVEDAPTMSGPVRGFPMALKLCSTAMTIIYNDHYSAAPTMTSHSIWSTWPSLTRSDKVERLPEVPQRISPVVVRRSSFSAKRGRSLRVTWLWLLHLAVDWVMESSDRSGMNWCFLQKRAICPSWLAKTIWLTGLKEGGDGSHV